MKAPTADRLLQLARELSGGSMTPEMQRELGRLLHTAASWQSNPLRRLLPKHAPTETYAEHDAAMILRELLREREHMPDGDLVELALRVLHLSRGDRDLIAMRGRIIEKLEDRSSARSVPQITPAMWRAGWSAYADWLRIAYRYGQPSDSQVDAGVEMAITAMRLAGADHG